MGSAVGRVIDQQVLGLGSDAVEVGKIDRFRLNGAAEGAPIPRVFGRVRVGGQIIWATRFKEHQATTGGSGKGAPKAPKQTSYSYSVSLAVALCEGPIRSVGRIWADGREIARDSISMRVYDGSEEQMADALIEAIEGVDEAPAYRGTAYVVIEDLDLTPFGNRVPQFSFEVIRQVGSADQVSAPADLIKGVALVPGTGEYSLSTSAVHYNHGGGRRDPGNVNTLQAKADFRVAVDNLLNEIPNLRSVSLIVSWFGDDLRCGSCRVFPAVEQGEVEGDPHAWRVAGFDRASASVVPQVDGRPLYGGTPSDASVVEAIRYLNARGIDVMFYPFILMDQMDGNGLPDPWGGAEQAPLPWRGRITTSQAPGRPGTTDRTAAAEDEVKAFFGECTVDDIRISNSADESISVDGPKDESYRSFILHYAALCAEAGGVESFCVGSELRSLTQIRGSTDSFPAVSELIRLTDDVRQFLPSAKIGYAADWSEYFGYHPKDTANLHFHLDPLWAHDQIDFIGIDNYMPLSDWRDGEEHSDAGYGSLYSLDYLQSNIEGGEGYDWFYRSAAASEQQDRTEIDDLAYSEPWVWRYKDLRSWWQNPHHERLAGIRATAPTAWVPKSKPFRFTEYGCAAIDKATNQPNKFVDPKSSESSLPYYSTGRRDDLIQMQYIRALLSYWSDPSRNPISDVFSEPMLDLEHSLLWAWDARPWPAFPELASYWSDGENYGRGHWFSGRSALQPLALVIADICTASGIKYFDVSRVYGLVRGYKVDQVQTGRSDLQPLLLAQGVEVCERDGALVFFMRGGEPPIDIGSKDLVRIDGRTINTDRSGLAEAPGRVRVLHTREDGDFEVGVGDATLPGERPIPIQETELPLVLTAAEGQALAERFMTEARSGQESISLTVAPSLRGIRVGDMIRLDGTSDVWRVDRLEEADARKIEAVRVEPTAFEPSDPVDVFKAKSRPPVPIPVETVFLDLPTLTGAEVEHAPHVAATARPWPGPVAIYSSVQDAGYSLATTLESVCRMGVTLNELDWAQAALWDDGAELLVRFVAGDLASVTEEAVLAGANGAAIGDGSPSGWEVFQFQSVRLVEPGVWGLRRRLRGQRGTEFRIRDPWPTGSTIVLLDGRPSQVEIAPSALGYERHFRTGPAYLPYDHESYRHQAAVFGGEGLRPFSPAHLAASRQGAAISASWRRRTRLFSDGWDTNDVGLGEASERYAVKVRDGLGRILFEDEVVAPFWSGELVSVPDENDDLRLEVAQISDLVGAGAWATTLVTE
ncbi:MAG: glycoside hydrolase TIM-barrel-like domain-containing protein [Pseudomonadota bacterium]